MELEPKRRRATLTKNPPPSALASRPSLRKPQSSNSLQRSPSAPYGNSRSQVGSQSARDIHQRTGSSSNTYGSSTSSLERPSAPDSSFGPSTDHLPSTSVFKQAYPAPISSPDYRPNDLIGAPFDASSILSSIQATANGPTSNPNSRATDLPPLVHANTSPNLGMSQPQSIPPGGQPMTENTPPKQENGILSPKRFSGEAFLPKPTAMRKKSGFSSFVNSMLGSPRTIKISAPENPMHMIHVGYDNVTGQFTVSQVSTLAPSDIN
jgi:p21-activated kinase 1